MIKIIKIFITTALIICPLFAESAEMILTDNMKYIQAFYTQQDSIGWKVELKGKILLIGAETKSSNEVSEKVQDKSNASVRLYNNLGIEIGDTLYVINDNNLITGKLNISSVFFTKSFGYILLGKGNMKAVNIGDRVVQKIDATYSKKANALNGKGDYFRETGQTGKAISFYKNALEADRNNPEAHIALGYIYLEDEMIEYAHHEFMQAYKLKRKPYDNEDKYLLYQGLAEVRYKQAYYMNLPDDLRNKYINEGIDYCRQALTIHQDSKEINFYLGVFYFKNSQPQDVPAKEQFLKVIMLDQNNIEAYLALSELYEKHDNKPKAASYAEQALRIDPMNDRAKNLLKKFR
jgi:tetratricopeptide (TPR) repeat protein